MGEHDDLLAVNEKLDGLDPEELDKDQDFSPVPDGDYPCDLETVEGDLIVGKEKTSPVVKLKWKIAEGEFEGRFIFDTVYLFQEGEKGGSKKRRNLVAYRLGLINKEQFEAGNAKYDWRKAQGCRATVTTEVDSYTDDKGKEKTINRVTFSGYRLQSASDVQQEYTDI